MAVRLAAFRRQPALRRPAQQCFCLATDVRKYLACRLLFALPLSATSAEVVALTSARAAASSTAPRSVIDP